MSIPTTKGFYQKPPRFLRFRASPGFVVTVISVTCFTEMFLYGMIVPVLPSLLSSRAGVPNEDVQYWIAVLLICEAGMSLLFSPVFGCMSDRTGRYQLPYLIGLVLLAISMAFLTAARSIPMYIIARLLEGVSAAMVEVAGFALVVDVVDPENMGQMLGYLGTANSLGIAVGPLIGGLVNHVGGYYVVFGMAFGVIGIDFVLRLALVDQKTLRRWIPAESPTSPERQSLLGASSEEAPESAEAKSGGSSAIFVLLSQPRILIALWGVLVQGMMIATFDAVLPLFVGRIFNWYSLGGGLIFLPMVIPALFEPFYGYMSDRLGNRIIAFLSFLLLVVPLVLLRFVTQNLIEQKILLSVLLALIGFSVELGTPALLVEIEDVLESKEQDTPGIFGSIGAVGESFGLYSMACSTGLLLGPLWAGFIVDWAGWDTMGWTLGLLAGLTAIPMCWIGDRWFDVAAEQTSTTSSTEA